MIRSASFSTHSARPPTAPLSCGQLDPASFVAFGLVASRVGYFPFLFMEDYVGIYILESQSREI